ncbi:MAG: hypothetical protein GY866_32375, partial [Proteobacteria bacterium]|nr:hypothetical protein [Pseudomonadota bacterium]
MTGLDESTTYHYVVQSIDAGTNSVSSRVAYFETDSPEVDEPEFAFFGIMDPDLPPDFMASMTDDDDTDRVEFYIDGEHAGTDFSVPFEFTLDPAYMGMSRAEYMDDHEMEAWAFSPSGDTVHADLDFLGLPLGCDPPTEWFYRTPYEGQVISTSGETAEEGTSIDIWVDTSTTEWEYDHVSGHPDIETIVGTAVDRMEFFLDGVRLYNSSADTTTHIYEWDASGASVGDHRVMVKAY